MSEIQNQINQLIENREMARMGGGKVHYGAHDEYYTKSDQS